MVSLERVFKIISDVFSADVQAPTEKPEFENYPYDVAWKGHNQAIRTILNSDVSILSSPTGTGKTVIYLTAAVESGLKTLVIVPRNRLQEDVAGYEDYYRVPMLYLFDKSKHCNKKETEKSPTPCSKKFRKSGKWYFKYKGEYIEYPCRDCPYIERKSEIKKLFREGDCIAILNQGNFWMLRGEAEFVIIDEADETIRSITDAVTYPEVYESDDPIEVLDWMEGKVLEDIDKITKMLEVERDETKLYKLNKLLDNLERKLMKIAVFKRHPSELITYVKGRSTYVEWFNQDIVRIAKSIFSGAKLCLVTATPPQDIKNRVEFTLPFRAKVIYAPIGNLSERNVFRKGNEDLLEKAVDIIIKTYDYAVKISGMRKAPIHCGNLAKHGVKVYELLKMNGRKAILMEEGMQKEYIDKFLSGDYDFFCAVAIEYGYDWSFSPIQYILKVPFADLGDPRLQAIRKQLGKEKFNEWYNWDALSRLIQACGRNARRPDDFGITIILDSCFGRLYKRYESKIPQWFKDRLVWLGDLDGEGGS